MKVGTIVKVLWREANDKYPEIWRKAVIVHTEPNGCVVKDVDIFTDSCNTFFTNDKILKFIELDQETVKEHETNSLAEHIPFVQSVLDNFHLGEKAELKDRSISAYRSSISIDPVVYERRTIGSMIETLGYQVTKWAYHNGSQDSPPDVSDVPVATFARIEHAVECLVNELFAMKVRDYFQAKADQEFALALKDI